MTTRDGDPQIGYADILAFVCEIAMFAVVIAAVNYLVVGWRSWLIGIGVALLVALIWARWMAPTSSHRLTDPRRYVAQAVLFISIGALAAVSGLLWVGVVFTVTSVVAFAFSRTEHHGRGQGPFSSSFSKPASSRIGTPSCSAFSALEPGDSPTTT